MDFTAEGILARMKAALKNEDTKLEGSFSMDNLQAVAVELARFNAMLIVPILNDLSDRESDMGTSGNERHYIQWAKEVKKDGEKIVGNAKVYSPRNGTGDVYISIISITASTPSEEDIRFVQEYIDGKRPVGANPIVAAAASIPVSIACSVKKEAGYTEETLYTQIQKNIQTYLFENAFRSGTLSLNYYKISSIISGTDGIMEVNDLTINEARESIVAEYNEFFELEELSVNVIE